MAHPHGYGIRVAGLDHGIGLIYVQCDVADLKLSYLTKSLLSEKSDMNIKKL
jgi:hypothetical protein